MPDLEFKGGGTVSFGPLKISFDLSEDESSSLDDLIRYRDELLEKLKAVIEEIKRRGG